MALDQRLSEALLLSILSCAGYSQVARKANEDYATPALRRRAATAGAGGWRSLTPVVGSSGRATGSRMRS